MTPTLQSQSFHASDDRDIVIFARVKGSYVSEDRDIVIFARVKGSYLSEDRDSDTIKQKVLT